MGTWGPKLYQDDLANDIKIEYEELLKQGKSNEESIELIYKIYRDEIEDSDEMPIFWMALADVLCDNGNLTSFVKEKALKEIELGENLKKWEIESNKDMYIERKQELEKLKRKLEEYKETDKTNILIKSTVKQKSIGKEWKIGDTYAYKIKSLEYEGQYLIFRKIDDYRNNKKYQSAIIYVQITSNKQLPKTATEINELEYIIISNEGNVRHQYRMILTDIPKQKSSELIYLGNYLNIKTPKDEYIENTKFNIQGQLFINIWELSFKNIENLINVIKRLGTNKNPIYYKIDPKNISDSHIRFLMRVKYYKEILKIEPPKDAIVKNDPLLYISLVDSLMIGGIVENPVGTVTKEVKEVAIKKINELRTIISSSNDNDKGERINILNILEEKIKKY